MNNQTMIVNASGNAMTKIGRNHNGTARAREKGKQQQELPSTRGMGGVEKGRATCTSTAGQEVRHYVLIDGVLQLSTPSTSRWLQRAAKQVPAADEVKRQNLILQQAGNGQSALPVVRAAEAHPTLAAQPAAQVAQPVDMSGATEGRPSPNWVFDQVVKMCNEGQPGGFAYDFLDQLDPTFTAQIPNVTLDQLRAAIETDSIHPSLKAMMASPNFEKFLLEFYTAAKEAKKPIPVN